jgi:hypothetical protein
MKVSSFFPNQKKSVFYALSADDLELHFSRKDLTEKQLIDDLENKSLMCCLQVASLYFGKPNDHTSFYEAFLKDEWPEVMSRYHHFFKEMGMHPISLDNLHYYPQDCFYQSIESDKGESELVSIHLISGSNQCLHSDKTKLRISQEVNSKMRFAEIAKLNDIPVPETVVTDKSSLDSHVVKEFMTKYSPQVMLKVMGLSGARNVISISSIAEAKLYLDEYQDDLELVLQEKLDTSVWSEMTVDLLIDDLDISIANTRKILFSEGIWIGNYLNSKISLSDQQLAALIKVGECMRGLGYSEEEGLNCGIDFFVNGDEIKVIEVNARYTGGLFPAEILKRIGVTSTEIGSVAFFDVVSREKLGIYLDFVESCLHGKSPYNFSIAPMGFSPQTIELEGEKVNVWQVIVGDLEEFKLIKESFLGEGEMPTCERIIVETI